MKTYVHKLNGEIEVKEEQKQTDKTGNFVKVLEIEGGCTVTTMKYKNDNEKRDFSKFTL